MSRTEEEITMPKSRNAYETPTMIRATFNHPNGEVDHQYTFDMNDDASRVRFAIECKHAYQRKGTKITTEAL